jgi:hypothetical protein
MGERESTPQEQAARREIIKYSALLAFFLATGLLLGKWLLKYTWRDVIGMATLMAFIFLLVVLKRRYKRAERIIEGTFQWNFRLLFWWIIFFGPILLFYHLSPIIIRLTFWYKLAVFLIWGTLLAVGSMAVLIKRYREPFLLKLQEWFGRFAPCAYAFDLLVIAILFFSSLTFVLANNQLLKLNSPTAAAVSPETIRDFYSWHFFRAIPGLKLNETLRWKEPLTYESGWVGLVLIVFQLMVIIPVLTAFTWYWKRAPPKATERRHRIRRRGRREGWRRMPNRK